VTVEKLGLNETERQMRRLVAVAAVLGVGASLVGPGLTATAASAVKPVNPVNTAASPSSVATGAASAAGTTTRECRAIAHRMGPTAAIDANTLEALRRSSRMGVRAEVDFAPTLDGLVAFHANRWEQGSDGTGDVWETTQAYAASLTTTPNGQHVPSAAEVLDAAVRYHSRLLIELHHWAYWQPELLAHIVGKINQLNLWGRVWITGTRGALTALHDLVDATVLWRLDDESDLTLNAAVKLGVDLIGVSRGAPTSMIRPWRQAGYPVTGRQSRIRGYPWAVRHRILTLQTNTPGAWLAYCNAAIYPAADY
jgi:hypothetical protein